MWGVNRKGRALPGRRLLYTVPALYQLAFVALYMSSLLIGMGFGIVIADIFLLQGLWGWGVIMALAGIVSISILMTI